MRIILVLLATTALAACGGSDSGGVASVGSSGSSSSSSSSSGTTSNGVDYSQLLKPTSAHTYVGVGGEQVYKYTTQTSLTADTNAITFPNGQLALDFANTLPPNPGAAFVTQTQQTYAGNTSSIRNSAISISFDPAAATYTLTVTDAATAAATNTKFQDPASLISFAGGNPQWGTPNLSTVPTPLPGFQYYQAGDGNPISPYLVSGSGTLAGGTNSIIPYVVPGNSTSYESASLFVQTPGTTTQYVTLAGYLRNNLSFSYVGATATTAAYDLTVASLERGAFAFGEVTPASAVPTTGSATYNGNLLATMVYNQNPTLGGGNPTYFQWITGSAQASVNFASNTVGVSLTGTVSAPQIDNAVFYTPAEVQAAAASYVPQTAYYSTAQVLAASQSSTITLYNSQGVAYTPAQVATAAAAGGTLISPNAPPAPIVLYNPQGTAYSAAQVQAAAAQNALLQSPLPSTYQPGGSAIAAGSVFKASGSATINATSTGGFSGNVATATLTAPSTTSAAGVVTPGAVTTITPIAGSTLTGTFYGPAAQEIGGGFRVVGGVPNQRVDIVGAFTGK